MDKRKRVLIFTLVLLTVAGFCFVAFWAGLTIRSYTIESEKLSAPVRLVVITDLHSVFYGAGQEKLVRAIAAQSPDAVLLAGDIADDETPHAGTLSLLSAIGDKFPCFYVSGNHECWSGEVEAIKDMLRAYGVTILEGAGETLEIRGQVLQILGVDDPDNFTRRSYSGGDSWEGQLERCKAQIDGAAFSVLLSHRPERADYYRDSGFDLVLAGHAHGGQVRVPGLINGLFAPNQGWFPKYAGGRYELGETVMIVSRGLARNHIPRVFNPPELVVIDIE